MIGEHFCPLYSYNNKVVIFSSHEKISTESRFFFSFSSAEPFLFSSFSPPVLIYQKLFYDHSNLRIWAPGFLWGHGKLSFLWKQILSVFTDFLYRVIAHFSSLPLCLSKFQKNTPCHRFDLLLTLHHLCNLYPDILPSRVTKSDSSQLRILLFLNVHTTSLYQQNSSVLPPKKEKLPERGIILTPRALITMFSEEIISLLFCLSCILSPHTDVKTLLHHHSLLKRGPFRYAQLRTGISLFYRSSSKWPYTPHDWEL